MNKVQTMESEVLQADHLLHSDLLGVLTKWAVLKGLGFLVIRV